MTQPTPEHPPESVLVILARMEGKLDRVGDRVDDLRHRVDEHDGEIGTLKSRTQSLAEGALAAEKTALALAVALKDAKEATEATARHEADKSAVAEREAATKAALGWSPVTRVFAAGSFILAAILIYQAVTGK